MLFFDIVFWWAINGRNSQVIWQLRDVDRRGLEVVLLKTGQLIVTDGLSYYVSGHGMRSGIRVIGVVYVVVGNGAVSSTRAMRFTDEQYIYIVIFEKEFNFINMLVKSIGVPLGHPQEFSQFYFLLSSIVSMFIAMLFCCNN